MKHELLYLIHDGYSVRSRPLNPPMSAVERASAAADPEKGSSGSEEEELTAEEAAAAAVEQMQSLQASIAQLEQLLTPLLHTPLQSLTQQLPPVQAAKLQAALAYTTNALFLFYLHSTGAPTEKHPVRKELERVKKYLKKISDATAPAAAVPARPTKLDKGAASRFISAQLAGQSAKDAAAAKDGQNSDEDSGEEAADTGAAPMSDSSDDEEVAHATTLAAAAAALLPAKVAGKQAQAASAQSSGVGASSAVSGAASGAASGSASSASPSGKRSNATQKREESGKKKKKQKQAQ